MLRMTVIIPNAHTVILNEVKNLFIRIGNRGSTYS